MEDPFADLENVTVEDVKSVEKATGLSYEKYISIPKNEVLPLLRVVDFLSKVAVDHYTKNINIETTKDKITFRFNNDPYFLEYYIPNKSGKIIKQISIPTVHIRKLLANVITNIVLVESEDGSINVCIGDNLLFVETTPYDKVQYEFSFLECKETLDINYLKDHLRSFSSLLSCSERVTQKNVICKDGVSYIDAGAIIGKAKTFFGAKDQVVSQIVINSICALVDETKTAVKYSIEDNKATMEFLGLAKFAFNVTVGDAIEEFISPVFKDSFNYVNSALIVNETFKQLLSVIGTLDYFTSFVRIEFTEKEFVLTAHRKEGTPVNYTFKYMEGTVAPSVINVEIPVILAVLGKANNDTKYSTSGGNLIVDLGDVVYCIRSVN